MTGQVDTIAAIATPPGRGGIGVVRISGPGAAGIATAIVGAPPAPRTAGLRTFRDSAGNPIDRGIVLFFPGPHSYTGEDVLELQGHGGPAVLDAVLQAALAAGARPARPGEFTERAFLNDRLDLAQAEAVADLIEADTDAAASAALRSLEGAFSARVHALADSLTELRVYVEAAIDFSDEDIDFLSEGGVLERLDGVREALSALRREAGRGAALREGLRVAIAGAPNVGKSSLLNRLAGRDTAIVTAIAGTTRDVLREAISLDGLPLHVADTAGLRETGDPVEVEGVRRARAEITDADRILLVVDDRIGPTAEDRRLLNDLAAERVILIRNKCDLSGASPGRDDSGDLRLSATTGAGFETLVERLKDCAGYRSAEAGGFSARRRHLDALDRAGAALDSGRERLVAEQAGELLAEELRLAQEALGTITGTVSSDDLLGEIFASFCIGK
ncbi:tRNA modification GTPase trmE [Salinisphaera sp. PC39]|uniref:tRNA uridine-5-carboxymethylaminomethyl(34) synthesis GTPase MnmE n=1 Tax=Salinisphaera sp. PC39 TaxID=1304156 RepID=UPI003340C8C7